MLLFLANFPDEMTRHEGMSQRIIAIDKLYRDENRVYLFVSHRLFFKKQTVRIDDHAIQYRCNVVVHFFFILKLFRQAELLYFHSIMNVLPALPFLRFIKNGQRVTLDAHGLVTEEQRMAGTRWKSNLYQLSERRIFKKAHVVITVTNAMEYYFRKKHSKSKVRYLTWTNLPEHLKDIHYVPPKIVSDDLIRVVYSGNTQLWQNVDLIVQVIKNNLSPRIRYDILTGEREFMNRSLRDAGIHNEPSISVKTVAPEELETYYRAAHYGFMMRDDVDVSRVSCPTKMIEYMYFGMIPIVKTKKIGDFEEMGCESVLYDEFSAQSGPRKSLTNHLIIDRLLKHEHEWLVELNAMKPLY